jgi:hypothetical protein
VQCPGCHLEQIPVRHWVYQKNELTSLQFDKPKKFNLLAIPLAGFILCLLLMQLLANGYTQVYHDSARPNPAFGFRVIEEAVIFSAIFCIILLLYRELSYRWNLRWFAKKKQKSKERYFCAKCGARWDV